MRFIKTRKGVALAVTLVVVAAAAVGAYAFLTANGSGSGTATAGSPANNLVIVGSGTGTDDSTNPVTIANGITPANSVGVSFRIYNPNSYAVSVSSVSQDGTITNTNQGTAAYPAANSCDPSWFSFATDTFGTPETVPAHSLGVVHSDGLLAETESGTNQDGCGGATLTLNLKSA